MFNDTEFSICRPIFITKQKKIYREQIIQPIDFVDIKQPISETNQATLFSYVLSLR